MDQSVASRILKAALALDAALGELDIAVTQIPDAEERKIFAKKLGDIIGRVNDDFIRPIARQYPSLDPDPI